MKLDVHSYEFHLERVDKFHTHYTYLLTLLLIRTTCNYWQITLFKVCWSLSCLDYPTVSHLSTRSWWSLNEYTSRLMWHRGVVDVTTAQLHQSLNSGSAQVQMLLAACREDLRWWGSLTIVLAGNKTKCLSSVNHTTITLFISSAWEVVQFTYNQQYHLNKV